MKKGVVWGFLGLAFLAGSVSAGGQGPVAVSPGAERGEAVVRQACPTFSWTSVPWALTYKVAVFEARGGGIVRTYEAMAAQAAPVLVKEIPGQAFSWTPSADEALLNGGRYVWYVGAMVNAAQGSWSEGRAFVVAEGPGWGVVSEPPTGGERVKAAESALGSGKADLTGTAKGEFNLAADFRPQDWIGVEGTEGASNTLYGLEAGFGITTGVNNSFFGRQAGYADTSGYANTSVGRAAGKLNKTGWENTYIGFQAGNKSTADENVFVGARAGLENLSGSDNCFVGHEAGFKNVSGQGNSFFGFQSGYGNDGSWNTVVGAYAGYAITRGMDNVFIGGSSGEQNSGNDNVFIGKETGRLNNSGYGNVFIGNCAGYNELGANKLYIENTPSTTPLIYGDFSSDKLRFNGAIGIKKTPSYLLEVGTNGAFCNGGVWVDGSSREFKENIETLPAGEAEAAFDKLEPVKFQYRESDGETYIGFIAEDVPELVAMNDRKGLNAMDLVAVLTKVVQEQRSALREQHREILALREDIAKLKEDIRREK